MKNNSNSKTFRKRNTKRLKRRKKLKRRRNSRERNLKKSIKKINNRKNLRKKKQWGGMDAYSAGLARQKGVGLTADERAIRERLMETAMLKVEGDGKDQVDRAYALVDEHLERAKGVESLAEYTLEDLPYNRGPQSQQSSHRKKVSDLKSTLEALSYQQVLAYAKREKIKTNYVGTLEEVKEEDKGLLIQRIVNEKYGSEPEARVYGPASDKHFTSPQNFPVAESSLGAALDQIMDACTIM